MSVRPKAYRQCLIFVLVAVGLAGLFGSHCGSKKARIAFNGSPSAPIGFYWLTMKQPERGDLAFVQLPAVLEAYLVERRYLPAPMPVLKMISAVTGDRFCRNGSLIFINGRIVATALSEDTAGRPMPAWTGCSVLQDDEVVMLMPHPKSFDSRYFGPLSRRHILKVATPIWIWPI
jgi:conjugative transfer signal peptidase TraF